MSTTSIERVYRNLCISGTAEDGTAEHSIEKLPFIKPPLVIDRFLQPILAGS